MDESMSRAAMYAAELQVVYVRSWRRPWVWMIALGWVLFPFTVATLLHPSDVIRLTAKIEGLPIPHLFTVAQIASGFLQAVFALVVLVMFQFVGTVLFYRRAQLANLGRIAAPTLWPLAAVATGLIGNAAWLVVTGHLDWIGCLIGFSSAGFTVAAEKIIEGLGRDFVYGRALAGDHQPQW
jgi:hypothetical protein